MNTTIRNAAPEDMEAVARIFSHYVLNSVATFEEDPPATAYWRQRLSDLTALGQPFLVAEAAGEVVGYAYAGSWRPRPAYRHTVEDTIYLDPAWVGRGIGRMLLTALVEKCSEAGYRQMIAVIADTGSDSSLALHRALGFAPAGRLVQVGFKHGRWIDTCLMQRALPSVPPSD